MSSNSGDGVDSGGGQGGSSSGFNSARDIEREKFPFWGRMFRYSIAVCVQFVYWCFLGLVSVVGVSWIVGFGETWQSLVGFVSGVSWFFTNVADAADVVFVVAAVYYLWWLATHREFLNPMRDEEYTNPGVAKWKKLALSLPVSGGLAGGLVASSVGVISVNSGVFAVLYWVSAYYSARALTSTLLEDAEWETWFGFQLPWKWTAWVSVSYGVYFAVEGGLMFLSPAVSVGLSIAVPFVGVAYLVRRELGKAGVVSVGRRMTAAALRRRMRGEDDVEEIGDERSKRRDGQSSPSDNYDVSEDNESGGIEFGGDLDVVGGGDARWGYDNGRDSASVGSASESVESVSEDGENTVEGGGSSDEREFDSWDGESVDESALSEGDDDDQWEYDIDDV